MTRQVPIRAALGARRWRLAAGGAVSAPGLLVSAGAAAQQTGPYYRHPMWEGGWFFGPIMMIVFLAIAAVVVVLVVRYLGGLGHLPGLHGKTPLDILKERYARGEIDKAEFEERRRVLGE